MRRMYVLGLCLGLMICAVPGYGDPARAQTETLRVPPKEAEQLIARRARQVILALKSRNLPALSTLVHQQKGLRFSPYHAVEKGRDLVFTRSRVRNLLAGKKRYLWGEEDGSGDQIRLTYVAYHRLYVYDHDYAKAKHVTYNADNLSSGNLVNNLHQSYPAAIIVEYNFPGFKEAAGGMDWKSLFLVFEKQGSDWYLVGIAHGEWTI